MAGSFDIKKIEQDAREYWEKHDTYREVKQKNKGKQKFYFLIGPPYTNGKIHIGHAWNHALKDFAIRYYRMKGFDVWDRAGWDTHGLPTEWAVMKKHGLKDDHDVRAFGEDRFVDECREFCVENMAAMTRTLKEFGVWLDFDDPYMTLSKDWMNGVWWFVKRAHEQGRLYEGLRTMTWDIPAATAVAKHELEYQEVEDSAIFVKFALKERQDEHLVIWTTTPWTIPFNLAVMVNPELEYVKVKVTHNSKTEYWWVVQELAEYFLGLIESSYLVVEKKKGKEMEGWSYIHPFASDMGYDQMEFEKLHTVLLSKEFVDTSAGSGLVHCAPGCGPEDFEVGYRNGLPAFNTVNEHGVFERAGRFSGLVARRDDKKFIEALKECGSLIHTHSYVHDYPHDQRSKQPVIFRTTKQWFIKVEDIQQEMIKENNEIVWQPKAGYNAFNSWLENLRDNSISKQRYWGTPLPIWRNKEDADDYIVVGSSDELEKLTGKCFDDLHRASLRGVTISKDAKVYERVPDVIDVWVDAGIASYACLKFPMVKGDFDEYFPADLIIEGKDQIRGWFNLLHVVSMVAFGKKAFKACYMHGFVNDSQGRKMSKSLQNYIEPQEVTSKFGNDVTRLYFVGCAQAGVDANYNHEDVEQRFRNLAVLWNTHNYLADIVRATGFGDQEIESGTQHYGLEERYILSKLSSMTKSVEKAMSEYQFHVVPGLLESFWLDLSRTYIQLVREKANGSNEERLAVFSTLARCLKDTIIMLSSLAPHVAESMWQGLASVYGGESVHSQSWPVVDDSLVDVELEKGVRIAQSVITAGLAAREKARIGVRWPLARVTLQVADKEVVAGVVDMITSQLNVKELVFDTVPVTYEAKPDYKAIGTLFGERTGEVLVMLKKNMDEVTKMLEQGKEEFEVEGFSLSKELFEVSVLPAEGLSAVVFDQGLLSLDTQLTPALEAEGFVRELTRRVQQMRKEAGLERSQKVVLMLSGDTQGLDVELLKERVGASEIRIGGEKEFTIKDRKFLLGIDVA